MIDFCLKCFAFLLLEKILLPSFEVFSPKLFFVEIIGGGSDDYLD